MAEQPLPREIFDRLTAAPGQVLVMRHEFDRVPVHWHDYYEFVYVLDGHATHHHNGRDEVVSAGSAMLLGPTDFHGYSSDPGQSLRCFNIAIDPGFAEDQLASVLVDERLDRSWAVPDLMSAEPLFQQLWSESVSADHGRELMIESLLTCLLISFARTLPVPSAADTPAADAAMRQAVFFIERRFREPLTLREVAARAHLSPNHFSERFHAFTGSTFQTYLQHRRLRFARSLMRSSELSVAGAARAVGLNDPSHFARAYRQFFGTSPSVDRARQAGA
ncbi:AraC family transcriptional regulator [Microlunatus soli]|uniref:AraC family transcriptional regulator n=1 Tax=Microlunatus soli TaxID=630515 RepID=UPI0012F72D5C|nr:AraC family transcriptional regulator [Microlunatus soli]